MKSVNIIAIFNILLFSSVCFATEAPSWTGNYVNDYANVLDNKQKIESMLVSLEDRTTAEFAVVTLSSLPADETMETYAYKIFSTWGIGKNEKDNGLLFLLIANGTPGSRMRIEVGYGLEGDIPDSAAGRILDKALPYYTDGNYGQAAYIVVSGIDSRLSGNYTDSGEDDLSQYGMWGVMLMVVSMIIAFLPIIFIFIVIGVIIGSREKCPRCGSIKVKCVEQVCTCQKCGFKFRRKKKKRHAFYPVAVGGGGWGGGGFGGGGFGGGASGGGGAGR